MPGQWRSSVFEIARILKAIPELEELEPRELRDFADLWHQAASRFIGERVFEDTWAEFLGEFAKVKYPSGVDPMKELLEKADRTERPEVAMQYDSREMRWLVKFCRKLQQNAGNRPFYLACRTADRLLRIDHHRAAGHLNVLVTDRVLRLAKPGDHRRAARYRYVGGDAKSSLRAIPRENINSVDLNL